MSMWLPQFVCPQCMTPVGLAGDAVVRCRDCGRSYDRRDGIWQFLLEERNPRLDAFARQFRAVRQHEGRGRDSSDYFRSLPWVPADDPFAGEWRIRRESYRHLLRRAFSTRPQPATVLDLGAGNGWLSNRLSTLGHHVVAVDTLTDPVEGLGMIRQFATAIVAVRADFDALPFAPGQFDVVVFNASLHYAPDPRASLTGARPMLAMGGTLVVMDSPMFRTDPDGAAMVADSVRRLTSDNGFREFVQPGRGYLTFGSLAASAGALQLQSEFIPSRGPVAWRVRRHLARFRLRRQPAAFGIWMAR